MPAPLPLDLPRLVMRRATVVGVAVLLLALALGLQRVEDDVREEVDAAMHLATLVSRLGTLAPLDDASALATLRAMQQEAPLRHLALHIHRADGLTLLAPPPAQDDDALATLLRLHARIAAPDEPRRVSWLVPRPQGPAWVLSLDATGDSERREALASLVDTLALLLLAIGGLLAVMRWNVRRALAPLAGLVQAIQGLETTGTAAVARLPAMPVRELGAIAAALRHLAGALDAAEHRRRLLGQKLLTLQEDERHHLARELHDELGQRLTALRFDAAWLQRQLAAPQPDRSAGAAELGEVVQGMAQRCAELQADVRQLLVQLDPLGPVARDGSADGLPLARLVQLLAALVQGWQATPAAGHGPAPRFQTSFGLGGETGPLQPLPPGQAESLRLPHALALALYRISQEALTNAARHARATEIELRLALEGGPQAEARAWLHWSVQDDGTGIAQADAALQRGNGLAGMQERVWALGGIWHSAAAASGTTACAPGSARPGWRLQARLPLQADLPEARSHA